MLTREQKLESLNPEVAASFKIAQDLVFGGMSVAKACKSAEVGVSTYYRTRQFLDTDTEALSLTEFNRVMKAEKPSGKVKRKYRRSASKVISVPPATPSDISNFVKASTENTVSETPLVMIIGDEAKIAKLISTFFSNEAQV